MYERLTWKLTLPYVKIDIQMEFAVCINSRLSVST